MKVNREYNRKQIELKQGHLYEFKDTCCNFLAIYLENFDGKPHLIDLEDNDIYDDIENYEPIREFDFEINLLNEVQ